MVKEAYGIDGIRISLLIEPRLCTKQRFPKHLQMHRESSMIMIRKFSNGPFGADAVNNKKCHELVETMDSIILSQLGNDNNDHNLAARRI